MHAAEQRLKVGHARGDFGRPRANFPRKNSKEIIRNNCFLSTKAKENWDIFKNLLKETIEWKRKTRDFSNTKLKTGIMFIYHYVLC